MFLPKWIQILPAFKRRPVGPLDPCLWAGYIGTLVMVVLALLVRHVLDAALPPGFPFLTFFPVVLVCTFIWGLWPGVLAGVLSGLASWYFFIPPFFSFGLDGPSTVAMAFYCFIVVTGIALVHTVTSAFISMARLRGEAVKRAEERLLLVRELDHRIKNVFATISALVKLSSAHSSSVSEFSNELRERILALGRTSAFLRGIESSFQTSAEGIAELVLKPYLDQFDGRIAIMGVGQLVDAREAQALSLLLHELISNALKHGALSQPGGMIEIAFTTLETSDGGLRVSWTEKGVTRFHGAARAGFGSVLLDRVTRSMGGGVERSFATDGIRVVMTIPGTRAWADSGL